MVDKSICYIDEQYGKMIAAINAGSLPVKRGSGAYLSMVDSVKTSLAYLDQNNALLSQSKEVQDKLKGSLSQVNQLQGKLQTRFWSYGLPKCIK